MLERHDQLCSVCNNAMVSDLAPATFRCPACGFFASKLPVRINAKGKRYSPSGQDRKARGVKRGLPDIIIMTAQVRGVFGIELKSDDGVLDPDQRAVALAWSKFDYDIYVARSLEDVRAILEARSVPMRLQARLS